MNLKDLDLSSVINNIPENLEDMTLSAPKQSKDENIYSISLRKENLTSGTYKARIRFLPNLENIKESIIAKINYWLTDANKENGFYVDSPKSIGEDCPISKTYFKYKDSTNPVEQRYAEMLKMNRQYFSYVQILQDSQHPELEGRVMIFRYGTKINEKISEEMNDKDDGGNPFDLMNGREFKIEVKMVGGFQNYDSCKFVGVRTPVTVDGKVLDANNLKLLEKLYADAPDIKNYKFKPWTAETTERVYANLKTYTKGFTPTAIENAMKQETDDDDVKSPVDTKTFDTDETDDFLDGINL